MKRGVTREMVEAQEYRRGQLLAAEMAYKWGLAGAIFRHRQATESWAKHNMPVIPWEAAAHLRGESDALLRLAQGGGE